MHVLILHNTGNLDVPSGERIVFDHEAEALRGIGARVTQHLVDNQQIAQANGLRKLAAATEAFWSLPAARVVNGLIQQHRPDVVHIHNVFPRLSMSVFAACRKAGVPVVHTLHNFRYLCVEGCFFRAGMLCRDCITGSKWSGVRHRCVQGSLAASTLLTAANWAHVNFRSLFRHVDCFVCVSQFVRKTFSDCGFPDEKLVVKYHGIPQSDETIPRVVGGRFMPFTVLFVGRLCPAKGTRILQELPELLPDVSLRIVGAGPDAVGLGAHYRQQRLRNVTMLGRLEPEQVRSELQNASCIVIPSTCPESFGLVAAEAMAVGKPIVASQIGALTELVHQSQAGVTVPFDQGAGPFALAIRRFSEDSERATRMGAEGQAFARHHFSLERSARSLVDIYESVMTRRLSRFETPVCDRSGPMQKDNTDVPD